MSKWWEPVHHCPGKKLVLVGTVIHTSIEPGLAEKASDQELFDASADTYSLDTVEPLKTPFALDVFSSVSLEFRL